MKLTCDITRLKDAILIADRLSGKKTSLPVLRFTLFIASDKGLKLRATNLDVGVEIDIPAKVEQEGVTAVPGDILGSFLSCLSIEKQVAIELMRENILITTQKQSTLIKCAGYEDFPNIPVPEEGISFSIDGKLLFAGFRGVIFAASLSDIKPEFASVLMTHEEGRLVFAATDSSRLAEKRIAMKGLPSEPFTVLIPIRNVTEIMRVLEQYPGVVVVTVTKHQVAVVGERFRITSRLIDGVFPDYKQIIPKEYATQATLLREDILAALKITSVFSGKLQHVRLKISSAEKIFEVEARSNDIGENTTKVDAAIEGDDLELLLNQRLMVDALNYLTVDSVHIGASAGKPLMLSGVGDGSFLYLVMPMRG